MSLAEFERTTCACSRCVSCCKTQPGCLAHGDFERIAAHLEETHEQAAQHFCASRGALIASTSTGETARVGTITPRRNARGHCVFLDEHDRCTIHAVAPAGCALFDMHMGAEEGQRRALAIVQSQIEPEYQMLRLRMEKQ